MTRKERYMTTMGRKALRICTMEGEILLTHFQGIEMFSSVIDTGFSLYFSKAHKNDFLEK